MRDFVDRSEARVSLAPPFRHGFASLYLLSAALVLLGGYLKLHDADGHPVTVAMRDVFGTHLTYQAALLLAIAFLHRIKGQVRDSLTLLAVLGVFMVDGLMLQHLYGWERGEGLVAAALGSTAAVLSLAVAGWILRLSLLTRGFACLLGAILFVRFGPTLLVGAPPGEGVAPRFVVLGFLLAALPLLVYLPVPSRAPSRLPLVAMERAAVGLALAAGAFHFVNAGRSFDLGFHLLYLAPFVIVLAPALEQLMPGLRSDPGTRRAIGALPYVGLALSASSFPPGLLAQHWAQAWPLTPFYLSLLLAAVVQLGRGVQNDSPQLRHAGAFLLVVACLGGDLPEALAAARFPHLFQVLAVDAVAAWTVARARDRSAGTLLLALASFVSASFLAERGVPWGVAFLLLLAWSGLALERLSRWLLDPAARLALAAILTVMPVMTFLLEHDSRSRLGVAAAALAAAFLFACVRRDPVLLRLAPLSAGLGLVGYAALAGDHQRTSPGEVATELGFVLLALGLVRSVWGGRIVEEWRILVPRRRKVASPTAGEARS